MASSSKKQVRIDEVGRSLVSISVSRDELNDVLGSLPSDAGLNPVTLEYELNFLKIISVGWGISFFMAEMECKQAVSEIYWNRIYEISRNISSIASTSLGKRVAYFDILRSRINAYANALSAFHGDAEPDSVIGKTFARLCGDEGNANAVICGKRTFSEAIACVKSFLDSIEIV